MASLVRWGSVVQRPMSYMYFVCSVLALYIMFLCCVLVRSIVIKALPFLDEFIVFTVWLFKGQSPSKCMRGSSMRMSP